MRRLPGWGGAAIAAALVAALVFSVDGGNAPGDYADARLASALDRQLVASQPIGAETRILRSEEHTSELQSIMRISYAVFCLKKKKIITTTDNVIINHTHKYN